MYAIDAVAEERSRNNEEKSDAPSVCASSVGIWPIGCLFHTLLEKEVRLCLVFHHVVILFTHDFVTYCNLLGYRSLYIII